MECIPIGLEFKGRIKGAHANGFRISADIAGRTLYGTLEFDFSCGGMLLFPGPSLSPLNVHSSSLLRPSPWPRSVAEPLKRTSRARASSPSPAAPATPSAR
eukprot:RCo032791